MILMGAGLIVRLLGFCNRIYLSNLVGAEGMGLIQLASPVYSLIILTLTSGVSITVSGMTAQARARGDLQGALRVCKTALAILLVSGAVAGVLLAGGARFLSVHVLRDARTRLSLMMLAPCIPSVAAASALKGYFYGMSRMVPTALSQIVEQLVRIGCILVLADFIAGRHAGGADLEYVCALALISSAIGEMANLAVVAVAFLRENHGPRIAAPCISRREAAEAVLRASTPIALNRFTVSVMAIVESVLLPARLLAGGLHYTESIEMLGRISGMCMPLLSFPTLVTSALATTLVPAISEALARENYTLANRRISRCIRLSFLMGFLCFALFHVFGQQIAALCYREAGVGALLRRMSYCCILLYVQQTLTGILNGLGRQRFSLFSTLAGYAVRFFFIWFLVPLYGVSAYIWGELTGLAAVVLMNLVYIVRTTCAVLDVGSWILSPALPALAFLATGTLLMRSPLGQYPWGYAATAVISVFSSAAVYGIMRNASGPFGNVRAGK